MSGRRALGALALLLLAWAGFGLWIRSRRAPELPRPAGEVRGAYHVHTRKSDGRGTLDEVVAAARQAGLQFVVISDHNVLAPEDAGWRGGVLVIEASEVSSPYGHIVGLGLPRALTKEERLRDTLGSISALGGAAALAHPLHPKRPFARWSRHDWVGFEVISNDSFWGNTLHGRHLLRALAAVLAFPWDDAQSPLALYRRPDAELARYDALDPAERHPLLCSADAHGWPSYRAAFRAFSMHVPVRLTGDAPEDSARVISALLEGNAACVFDGVAPAWGADLRLDPARDAFTFTAEQAAPSRASYVLLRDGQPFGAARPVPGGARFECGGPCPRGAYRVEARWGGRPWIFTNPAYIE
ncbi:PHP domain-containing protein [Anaeromyxobacter paludicola]|uniref:Phosphotransferase n=1 Tax=Anaeromyxobacter paludicola TaxID=2918171 RepID=A0ABM7X8L6_9BACT|nr:PHP domain-containing protein [Anaeromyxobacter paludicola]BDG08161.1 phosphotransferase [Anaeromyxobacter paludicola]